MSDIKWGETHCLVCEKPFAKDADYDEGYRLEQTYGVDSQPVQEFDARLCWADCYDFDTILKRLGELLAERDRLRDENMRLQSLADNLAHDAGQLRRDGIRLRAALSDALHELASQRIGAAMTLIEGALDKDGDA